MRAQEFTAMRLLLVCLIACTSDKAGIVSGEPDPSGSGDDGGGSGGGADAGDAAGGDMGGDGAGTEGSSGAEGAGGDTGTTGDGGGADEGGDGSATPWVELRSPADGDLVENPVLFQVAGDGVDQLVLSADGWAMVEWDPAESGWSASYTFTGTGVPREVLLEGLDSSGAVVASDSATITVAPSETEGVVLDVPYFYQYDNDYEPGGTCGITSTAMALGWWYPGVWTPDELYLTYGKPQAQSPDGITEIMEWEGLYADYTYGGTRDQIRDHLDAGRPVIVHGYWTSAGHIAVIVGYTDTDWIVNDPAGDWYVCYGCGEADHILYPIGGAWDDEMSWDGDLWFSTSDDRAF
jgi:hypothetical protein